MTDDDGFVRNELRITCADAVELVTHYLDDALVEADLADFETHLSLCEGCQVFLDQVRQTVTLVGTTADTTIDVLPANFDALVGALEERAEEEGRESP